MDTISRFFVNLKRYMLYALNPVNVLTDNNKHKWFLHLFLPAFAWMLFFIQVGLYRRIETDYSCGKVVLLSMTGFALGYACVLISSVFLSAMLILFRIRIRIDRSIACVALSHTYMFFSMVLGLIYFLTGNGSPTSFGVTGLLCTLLPIYSGIRKLAVSNAFAAPLLASVTGVLLLVGWQAVLMLNI